ncbi:MAG: hypothetical protein EBX99_06450, partial [Acidimicrobiia bacterium]|nr:hypothetical protein [Acidimicrobiia bacterium]
MCRRDRRHNHDDDLHVDGDVVLPGTVDEPDGGGANDVVTLGLVVVAFGSVVVVAFGSVVVDATGGRFVSGASLVNSDGRHFPVAGAGAEPSSSMMRAINTSLPAATGCMPSFH